MSSKCFPEFPTSKPRETGWWGWGGGWCAPFPFKLPVCWFVGVGIKAALATIPKPDPPPCCIIVESNLPPEQPRMVLGWNPETAVEKGGMWCCVPWGV